VLLPFSAIGLLAFGLGLLGFIPFVTALVYLRNARQAWRQARAQHMAWPLAGRLALAVAGLAVTVLLPAIAQSQAAWLLPGSASPPAECSANTVD
jgi:membrane protease YdiL (CAAX protease family)